jgi:peptide/nickel transport system substrate-binding protein
VGQVPSSPNEGTSALASLISVESLARLGDDGRPVPQLAKDWTLSPDGLTLTVNIRPSVKFHDGSPMSGSSVAIALQAGLANIMGPAFKDFESVSAPNNSQVVLRFRTSSPFTLDALETPIQKAGTVPGAASVATGPFVVVDPKSRTEMRANPDYYLGRPMVERVVVRTFPSVRAAWAELLRGQLDMLYEVGVDALDSLESSSSISTFTFTRRYQYVMVLNTDADVFRSKDVRRALNTAIDRDGLVREALNGHATGSTGPVWPRNYAFRKDAADFRIDPAAAARLLSSKRGTSARSRSVHFTCLVRPDAMHERIALVIKRQLQAIGVDMTVEEAPIDRTVGALRSRQFEAVLMEMVSAPTLLRPYQMWHSGGAAGANMPAIDAALDQVRHAASDDEYVKSVAAFQQAVVDDPPAIFLAWIERARAVSKRFIVPPPEPGRDILASMRLWKPTTDARQAGRN